jgi:hypothetical protein
MSSRETAQPQSDSKLVVRSEELPQILASATTAWHGCSLSAARDALNLIIRLGVVEVKD